MEQFISDDFLLKNNIAKKLYHGVAKDIPIIDFHNHLNADEILHDEPFNNLTELWLAGDHYKWRAMRTNGECERNITGKTGDYDKFLSWAKTVPNMLGNPLYHWTHLELANYFNVHELLNEQTAPNIWEQVNEELEQNKLSPRKLLAKDKVEFVGTTDDPADDLHAHIQLKQEQIGVKVSPTFRPDKGIQIEDAAFKTWLERLEEVTQTSITGYDQLLQALSERLDFFVEHNCKSSDHSISCAFYEQATNDEVETIFEKRLRGKTLTETEIAKYKTYTLVSLGEMYAAKDLVMQLHIGAKRNNNMRMFQQLGADSGFDSIGDNSLAKPLNRLLNALEQTDSLPKTILYGLNPRDNYVLATMAGNFQKGTTPGKIQFGPAWWFNDHIDGMEEQMKILANTGLMRHFVGMLTDSRSLLSLSRHEYFRRILCNLLGTWVEEGIAPNNLALLEGYVQDICYDNSKRYFQID